MYSYITGMHPEMTCMDSASLRPCSHERIFPSRSSNAQASMEVVTRTDSSADDPPRQTILRSTAAEKSVAEESTRVNRA